MIKQHLDEELGGVIPTRVSRKLFQRLNPETMAQYLPQEKVEELGLCQALEEMYRSPESGALRIVSGDHPSLGLTNTEEVYLP